MSAGRIAQLQDMLAARTADGSSRLGYRRNVQMVRAELARLQQQEVRRGQT